MKPSGYPLLLQLLLRLHPHQHQNVNDNRQYRRGDLHQANIPAHALHGTKPIKIDFGLELLLDCSRGRRACPTPQIVAFSVFILFGAVETGSHTPDNEVANHDYPCECGSDNGSAVSVLDASTAIRNHNGEVE